MTIEIGTVEIQTGINVSKVMLTSELPAAHPAREVAGVEAERERKLDEDLWRVYGLSVGLILFQAGSPAHG